MNSQSQKHNLTDTSFIVHFRRDSEDRVHNLRTILDFFDQYIDAADITIVNDDVTPDSILEEITKQYPNIRILFLENNYEFMKSASFNEASKYVKGSVFCFYDVDVLIDPIFLQKSQQAILDNKVDHIYPFNGLFVDVQKCFFPELKNFSFNSLLYELESRKIGWANDNLIVASDSSPGGATMISKEAFERMKGFDTGFIGWGFEDTDFLYRSRKVNKVEHLSDVNAICWHLHHDNAIRLENTHYRANIQKFNKNVNTI